MFITADDNARIFPSTVLNVTASLHSDWLPCNVPRATIMKPDFVLSYRDSGSAKSETTQTGNNSDLIRFKEYQSRLSGETATRHYAEVLV